MEPIPRFWAARTTTVPTPRRGEVPVDVWGWSDRSREDALSRAERRAQELAARGIEDSRAAEYYPGRPVREEILEEVRGDDGALLAVITRNRYGAAVLNTDAVLIADVDLPASALARGRRGSGRGAGPAAGAGGERPSLLGRLFGRRAQAPAAAGDDASVGAAARPGTGPDDAPGVTDALDATPEATAVRERVEAFAGAHPDWGVHLHRTAAGFRVLISGTGAAPASEQARGILDELGSDPLYVRLCAAQGSYRARLAPKPWRVGRAALGVRWPAEGRAADEYASWVRDFESSCAGSAACRRVWWNGVEPTSDAERRLLALHDERSGADSGHGLA
ncbi:hypothetical protein [Brachybacterium sp. ACRRE]|uniref:hypothetical protein n=1 Tax=Brachybacterium sp. ACRRE TaxID=2918184 RepID=UPI001EF3C0E1|nr:hypothetical protein [Brachybacterium sp. ACRRE]MCG7309379.1 hypothetical protein [Brachybacterium sp. ACRRE]